MAHQITRKLSKDEARRQVWAELRRFARPDSRFHWDFGEFIADFEGSELCAEKIRALDWYRQSQFIFITPDNCLETLRRYAILDQKALVVSTYGITRGFHFLEPGSVKPGEERLAATLDGMEYFARPISLDEIAERGPFGLLVTGASVITPEGIRWGKGHGFFDLEWAMFTEIGAAVPDTPIIAVGHDCQFRNVELEVSPFDTIIDLIVTPTRNLSVQSGYSKPHGIFWERLSPEMLAAIPPLKELHDKR